MADPTELNGQITDAVTQSHVMTVGNAPALALAQVYQSAAQALGLAAQNAVSGQQAAAVLAQSVLATLGARIVRPVRLAGRITTSRRAASAWALT